MDQSHRYDAFTTPVRFLAVWVLALANFLVALDLTVANVAVPHIAGDLGIAPDQGAWVITSYAVADAISVPLTGWLAGRFGAVRMFIACLLGFGAMSFLCGIAPTLGMLVVVRIGQGLCGGPLMALSQTLIARIVPPGQRGQALSFWGMTAALGPGLGPIIGGSITDNFSWHWIFFINIPIVLFCASAAYILLRRVETSTEQRSIDVVGLALLVFWIGSLQIVLDIGRNRDWLADTHVMVLSLCALIGFLAFLIWELTEVHPIVDLAIFRYVGFSTGAATLALCYGAYFASIVVIPQWLQLAQGYPGMEAGLVTACTALASVVTAPVAARLLGRFDTRILISGGLFVMACTGLARAGWTSGVDFWTLAVPLLIQGLVMPFAMVPLTILSISSVKPAEIASAAGLQNFLRTMSIAVSAALALTFWSDGQRVARSEIVAGLQPGMASADLTGHGFSPQQAAGVLSSIVEQEAMIVSLNHLFLFTSAITFLAAALIWIGPRPGHALGAPAAH